MIPLFWPTIFREEWGKALDGVFQTRWIGQGPQVDAFEDAFAAKFDFPFCLALNSCTSALALAYHLVGLRPGDIVLTPVLTCTATNIPLLHLGADIRFVDIDPWTLTMDLEDFRRKCTEEVAAVVVVTLGGVPCAPEIYKIAASMDIPVIVDAAQSLGVGMPHGDLVCYSFQAIKHFTTGDGGMLCLHDFELYERAKKLRWFGIDREAKKKADWMCIANHQMTMDIEEPGFKMHMNDIAATMGLVGLLHSDELLLQRHELVSHYVDALSSRIECVYGGSYWLFGILTSYRDGLAVALRAQDIECDLVHLRNDIFRAFGGTRQDLPNMNRLEGRYLYLPLHTNLTIADVERTTKCVLQYLL